MTSADIGVGRYRDRFEQVPAKEVARIHPGAIVRLDRVRELRRLGRLGRGDANIFLATGHALCLSRRYRDNLTGHLPF